MKVKENLHICAQTRYFIESMGELKRARVLLYSALREEFPEEAESMFDDLFMFQYDALSKVVADNVGRSIAKNIKCNDDFEITSI